MTLFPQPLTHINNKKCAGKTYFDMAKSQCTDIKEYKRQLKTVQTILSGKGYSYIFLDDGSPRARSTIIQLSTRNLC